MEKEVPPPNQRVEVSESDDDIWAEFRSPDQENGPTPAQSRSTGVSRFSQAEFSEIIKRATEIELARQAIEDNETSFSFEDLANVGEKLGLPIEALERAAKELKLKRNAISLIGDFHETKKRVTTWLLNQSPSGTRLETVSENEILFHFTGGDLGAKVSSLRVTFEKADEGITVFWKASYDPIEQRRSLSKKSGLAGLFLAVITGVLQLLSIAATGPLPFIFLFWALSFGIFLPYLSSNEEREANEKIAIMMSSAKELQKLETPNETHD